MRRFSLLFLLSPVILQGQIPVKEKEQLADRPVEKIGFRVHFFIDEKGDTIPVINLHAANITETRTFASKREERKWSKLKRDVAKVYPYSKIAGKKLREYNQKMEGMTPAEQKRMLKQAEKELMEEFEDDIRNMTINQGRILIKLIDRETGNTSYALVKDLRGTFQAFFWQSVAKIFNANLKSSYNPHQNKEDRMIEDIIVSIEDGTFVN